MSTGTLSPKASESNPTVEQQAQAPDHTMSTPERSEFTAPKQLVLVLLTLLPIWAIPLAHLTAHPETATGFFHYELPYYVANGRAAFERGNGILYPNPYDPAATAPNIYVHWLPWTLGFLTAECEFDPGDVTLIFTVAGSILFALATRALLAHCLDHSSVVNRVFPAAMWGGGVLAIAGLISGAFENRSLLESLLQYDPGNGLWFLNWGRNALFPTEAIYHTLVVFCWLAELRKQPKTANTFLLALATTHPWSGLELLLTINLWRGITFLKTRDTASRNQLLLSGAMLGAFLGYYKVWLPTFPQHAELQDVWKLNWSVSSVSATLAYLPLLIPAAIVVKKQLQTIGLTRTQQFLLCALATATGLAFHDRIIRPVQPIHFTRGYIWMPLFLLALPLLIQWCAAVHSKSRILTAGLCVLFVADNLAFSLVHIQRQANADDGFHLDRSERVLLQSLHSEPELRGRVVLSDSESLNYLMPTYASVRPWLGHHFNTPQFPDRKATWEKCIHNNVVMVKQIPDDVDVVVVRNLRDSSQMNAATAWHRVPISNPEWQVWKRDAR